MKYPKYDVYEILYKRYFLKGVEYFIREANLSFEDKVLDICGGNGRLTKQLLKFSNSVSYIEKEIDMIPSDLQKIGVKVYHDSIEHFVNCTKEKYTKVFCEQAINYWLCHIDMNQFSHLFEKDGIFIFNTFSKKPSKKPMLKDYILDNVHYLEISYRIKNKVYHIQLCEGYEPHFTVFDWISKKQYIKMLSPYFDIKIKDDGKSSLYICKRK